MSKVYLVTGANSGLGKDTCRQLALLEETKKVYVAARSQEKAQAAIDDLVENASVPAAKLAFFHFDPNESKEDITKSVEGLSDPFIHGLVLNAGGMGEATVTEPNKVTGMAQINLIGHVHLVDALLAAKKIGEKDGVKTRIVFSGSEVARGTPAIGMPNPKLEGKSAQDFKDILSGENYDKNIAYGQVKGIAALYFASFVREHPDIYAVTVSPGMTSGTAVTGQKGVSPVEAFMFKVMFIVFGWLGKSHTLEVGAKRYVDGVTGTDFDFAAGTFVASENGMTGPMSDQAVSSPAAVAYGQEETQKNAYEAVRSFA